MSQTFTAQEFYVSLEQLGEQTVRERVIAGIYGSGNKKLELAQEWLRGKEAERADAAESERSGIANKAADAATRAADAATRAASAAEEQARLARSANTRATAALIIALISAIIMIVDISISGI